MMKALTLWQPWASLMFVGHPPPKRNETRQWGTNYRGPLLIHSAKREPGWVRDTFRADPLRDLLRVHFAPPMLPSEFTDVVFDHYFSSLPRGKVLGRVSLVAVCRTSEIGPGVRPVERLLGDYSPDRFAWVTEGAVRLPHPVPARGHQGLWTLRDERVEEALRAVSA